MQVSITERWWPTMGVRALEQLERGGPLAAGELAEAARGRAARARRESSPPFIRRDQIQLLPSSHRGVYIGEIVNPVLGSDTHILAAEFHHLPPGVHTDRPRHAERLVHVMTGSGYSIIGDERIDWEPGDSIHI